MTTGDTAAGVPGPGHTADAADKAARYGPYDVDLVGALAPGHAAAPLRRQLLRRARPVKPIVVKPVIDHPEPAELSAMHHFAQL